MTDRHMAIVELVRAAQDNLLAAWSFFNECDPDQVDLAIRTVTASVNLYTGAVDMAARNGLHLPQSKACNTIVGEWRVRGGAA